MKKILLVLLLLLPFASNNVEATTSEATIQTEVTQGSGWELMGKVEAFYTLGHKCNVELYVKVVGNKTLYKIKFSGEFYPVVENPDYGNPKACEIAKKYKYMTAVGLYLNV